MFVTLVEKIVANGFKVGTVHTYRPDIRDFQACTWKQHTAGPGCDIISRQTFNSV